ncbi:MAG: CDP-glycerol--glycerophosphate glycerophosphotransferase [Deltaproteobacteria bacterium]|nr:CDP-glycerol--glycerophosphate glycerophosphotransferase [Deltaproteobacteria bacterium]
MKKYLFYASELYAFAILRPLEAAIFERGDNAAWFFEDRTRLAHFLREDEKEVQTVSDVKKYNPDAVFVPGNMVPGFFPGVKVEVFHGFSVNKRSREKGHFRIRDCFDLYCTQGPDTTIGFRELAQKHGFFEVAETGWPKMDPLFSETPPPYLKAGVRPIIFFASTFTPRLSAAPRLFETISLLAAKNDWQWIINFHPKMDHNVVEKYKAIQGQNITYIETDDIISLLKSADIMLCDTSSVISEFLLLNRPAVTFKNQKPGPHLIDVTDASQIESAIQHGLTRPEALMDNIRAYGDRIHPYRDGKSSVRVLEATDRFIEKGRAHLKPRPANIFRNLKLRRRLGYF